MNGIQGCRNGIQGCRGFREYAELCEIEPRLVPLLIDVMREQPGTGQFYARVKPRLRELVGWSAQQVALRNSEAYDVVYEVLYSLIYDAPERGQ